MDPSCHLCVEKALPKHLAQWARPFVAGYLCYGVDSLLLAAICDRETQGGTSKYLDQPGPKGRGDGGHGHGLMQIDDRFHKAFLQATFENGGPPLWEDPVQNVLYASKLLARNMKVLGVIEAAVAAYNAGVDKARKALGVIHGVDVDTTPSERIAALDRITYGGDYVSDVMRRRGQWPLPGGYSHEHVGA